ncbi:uncharacterized protein F4822DRAFT_435541 [Hypoxylon trugodes]|uniref:uncharacterized protein n=1 Tax=Hypoxylon trugodes TaxID=326681 RepID=UPI0021901BF3|nr:uncharacterized protein F4822DRAFT_435541 [Hypoxylon trugodes]KAI1382485.1 hypothetical protein F4822DRAFT_435541 [Hypoxylon trugodes]
MHNDSIKGSSPSSGTTTQLNSPSRYAEYINVSPPAHGPLAQLGSALPISSRASQGDRWACKTPQPTSDNRLVECPLYVPIAGFPFSSPGGIPNGFYPPDLFWKVQADLPYLATEENRFFFNLCFRANMPPPNPFDNAYWWAVSPAGQAFCDTTLYSLMTDLAPHHFVLTTFALLSYYRIVNGSNAFVPIPNCERFFSEFQKLHPFRDTKESAGGLLERVAFAVISTGSSLQSAVLAVPYLRPWQLYDCMEYNPSTAQLDVYCSARIARNCSHKEAVCSMNGVFGLRDGDLTRS